MDIYLSINNREQVIKLPVLPRSISIETPNNNYVFESVTLGSIKTIGLRGLKTLEIESFFPNNDYPFLRDRYYEGWEYVNTIEKWIEERVPIRVIITDTNINLPMAIEKFSYTVQDSTGDIYYTLALEEYKFINLKTVKR
jgi:hypothetical protein